MTLKVYFVTSRIHDHYTFMTPVTPESPSRIHPDLRHHLSSPPHRPVLLTPCFDPLP